MKFKILISLAIAMSVFTLTDAQNWLWVRQSGGAAGEGSTPKMMCIDNDQNIYFSGVFYSNPCYFPTDTLIPSGVYDFFLAKYDPQGNEIWVQKFGGNNTSDPMQSEQIHSINYCSHTNTVVIKGIFYGTTILGADTISGSPGWFVASMNTDGSYNWIKSSGNPVLITTSDDDGNVYAVYDILIPFAMIENHPVTPGVWLVKFASDGTFLWAQKKFNTNSTAHNFDGIISKMVVKDNKIFGIGYCSVDTFTVDTVHVHTNFLSGQYILFCLDTNGTARWIRPCSGVNSHFSSDIVVDQFKNSYITGPYYDIAIFDQDTLVTNDHVSEFFIAKYDSSGNLKWANTGQSAGFTISEQLAVDKNQNIYVNGSTTDTTIICNDTIIAVGIYPIAFTIKFDSSGNCLDALSSPDFVISSLVCDTNNYLYSSGVFFNTVDFSGTVMTSRGIGDLLVAKLSSITTSINAPEKKTNSLLIYANPMQGTCNVTIPDEFLHEKKLTLQIFDPQGKLLQQVPVEMNDDRIRLNLAEEAKGIYHVILSNGRKSYIGNIVFE